MSLSWGSKTKLWFFLVLLGAICTLGSTQLLFADNPVCKDLFVFYARGSGQPKGYDENELQARKPEFFSYQNGLLDALPASTTVEVTDLDYEAVGGLSHLINAEIGAYWWGDYRASVERGTNALVNDLTIRRLLCPESKFILAGYSQGAHVIGDALPRVSSGISNATVAVSLLGDPKHFDHEPNVEYFGSSKDKVGVLEPRIPYVPQSFANRVHSWCLQDDGICENNIIKEKFQNGAHDGYGGEVAARAGRIAAQNYLAFEQLAEGATIDRVQLQRGRSVTDIRSRARDIMFVIDRGYRMSPFIQSMRNSADEWVPTLFSSHDTDTRVGVLTYGDTGFGQKPQIIQPLTSDTSKVIAALKSFELESADDDNIGQSGFSALASAMINSPWRQSADKRVALVTTQGPSSPEVLEDGSRLTREMIFKLAATPNTIHIDTIALMGPGQVFQAIKFIADHTGGDTLNTHLVHDSTPYFNLINKYKSAPVAYAGENYYGEVGKPITFDASGSWLNGIEIKDWGWDFNLDGIFDKYSTEPFTEHTFMEPYDGYISVIPLEHIRNSRPRAYFHHSIATPRVVIGEQRLLIDPPPAPIELEAELLDPTTVRLRWQAPDAPNEFRIATAPSSVEGYVIRDQNGYPLLLTSSDQEEAVLENVPSGEELIFGITSANSQTVSSPVYSATISTPPALDDDTPTDQEEPSQPLKDDTTNNQSNVQENTDFQQPTARLDRATSQTAATNPSSLSPTSENNNSIEVSEDTETLTNSHVTPQQVLSDSTQDSGRSKGWLILTISAGLMLGLMTWLQGKKYLKGNH